MVVETLYFTNPIPLIFSPLPKRTIMNVKVEYSRRNNGKNSRHTSYIFYSKRAVLDDR